MDRHPITGKEVPWQFTKTGHHCNYAVASPHLLTFRADSAGFFDRATGGTARLSGFRSGCRNSLIPAGGVLNAPNYAHGCVCSYNIFTSLALVHTPEADLWTYNAFSTAKSAPQRLGINLGAPGDRLDENGTLWMEYPKQRDPSTSIHIEAEGESTTTYRRHTSQIEGDAKRWVAASGMEGLSQLNITLPGDTVPRDYTVRLYFAEPKSIADGERTFNVAIQGKTILEDFDVRKTAGSTDRMVVREFKDVTAKGEISISLNATAGETLLSGVEVVRQSDK